MNHDKSILTHSDNHFIRQTKTSIDYTFRLSTGMKVNSGQFVEVSIPKVGEAPISVSDFGEDGLKRPSAR